MSNSDECGPPLLILFGKQGQVAREIIHAAADRWPLKVYSSSDVDLRNLDAVDAALLNAPHGSWVINAAAYTQVDQAESEPNVAHQINALAPERIALHSRRRQLRLIHLSTDYVFSGEKEAPYVEDDPTGPLGVYGRTKLEGEQRIQNQLPEAIILRTSWVFSAHGKNFVRTMLRLGHQQRELAVVANQRGGPTSAVSIARTCLQILSQISSKPTDRNGGIYHYSGTPPTTWHEFAVEIFRLAQLPVSVRPITTAEYPTPARRPANSVLDCRRIQQDFGISPPSWKSDLRDVLSQLGFPQEVQQ
jgi:dTDP-4-dehydrorhamnose reductase